MVKKRKRVNGEKYSFAYTLRCQCRARPYAFDVNIDESPSVWRLLNRRVHASGTATRSAQLSKVRELPRTSGKSRERQNICFCTTDG